MYKNCCILKIVFPLNLSLYHFFSEPSFLGFKAILRRSRALSILAISYVLFHITILSRSISWLAKPPIPLTQTIPHPSPFHPQDLQNPEELLPFASKVTSPIQKPLSHTQPQSILPGPVVTNSSVESRSPGTRWVPF
ncbi:hypothetical protein EAF04_001558 [Stromatinia cepivora]|nr:hypothetical protein EAF04_001558 [Stromatinia cepivora]